MQAQGSAIRDTNASEILSDFSFNIFYQHNLFSLHDVVFFPTNFQNDLEEFYAMVNFTNPGILGDAAHFRRYFEVSLPLEFQKFNVNSYFLILFPQLCGV